MGQANNPQDIYDDPQFFTGYTQLERFRSDWGRAMEHNTFLELLVSITARSQRS